MADAPQVRKGTGPDQLPQDGAQQVQAELQQVHQDTSNLDATAAAQQVTVNTLQQQLATGQINQQEYDKQIGVIQGERVAAAGFKPSDTAMGQSVNNYIQNAGPGVQAGFQDRRPQGVQLQGPDTSTDQPTGPSAYLYGPAQGYEQQGAAPAAPQSTPAPPAGAAATLNALSEIIQDPDAPAQLRALVQVMQYFMNPGS